MAAFCSIVLAINKPIIVNWIPFRIDHLIEWRGRLSTNLRVIHIVLCVWCCWSMMIQYLLLRLNWWRNEESHWMQLIHRQNRMMKPLVSPIYLWNLFYFIRFIVDVESMMHAFDWRDIYSRWRRRHCRCLYFSSQLCLLIDMFIGIKFFSVLFLSNSMQ